MSVVPFFLSRLKWFLRICDQSRRDADIVRMINLVARDAGGMCCRNWEVLRGCAAGLMAMAKAKAGDA